MLQRSKSSFILFNFIMIKFKKQLFAHLVSVVSDILENNVPSAYPAFINLQDLFPRKVAYENHNKSGT